MKFGKDTKKYFLQQLKGNITNTLSLSLKSLNQKCPPTETAPTQCPNCKDPLLAPVCPICKLDAKTSPQTQFPENLVYKESIDQGQKMEDSMILCVDLSGSMSCTYRSKYKKVNQELVARILGEKNFQFLKKKIGLEKVLNNYTVYQMLLSQGESARNIAEMVKMEENNKYGSSSSKNKQAQGQKLKQEVEQYISRKQIIEIAVSKCLNIMKTRNPNTYITVVYFNDTIEIPINGFNDKLIIPGIDTKDVQQMISLGTEYSSKISIQKAANLGENLVMHLTKAVENGQTALGPALAFCLGLAKAFHHSLTQIVVVTDGMSNIGFGQTQNQFQQDQTKKFYYELALKYAKPLNCIVDVLTFQDCCIGYDKLDSLVEFTGGIPCQIEFTQEGGEKTVTQDTFSNITFRMITAFCDYSSQLCFETRTIFLCSHQEVKLNISNQLKPFLEVDKGNYIILNTGIRSGSSAFEIGFSLPADSQFQGTLKFTVISTFKKNNRKTTTICSEKLKITKGTKAQAQKQQAQILQKQIKQKLKPRQIFQQDIQSYTSISMKIEQNENIVNNLDQALLEKFKMKKEMLQVQLQNVDKLAKEKMEMRSRAQKTYKEEKDDFDDGFM